MKSNDLKPCPFCGADADIKFIGNDYTKKRSVEIKCTKCFTLQKTGTIMFGHAQCEEWAKEEWNARFVF